VQNENFQQPAPKLFKQVDANDSIPRTRDLVDFDVAVCVTTFSTVNDSFFLDSFFDTLTSISEDNQYKNDENKSTQQK
jgi:hypothetical protein